MKAHALCRTELRRLPVGAGAPRTSCEHRVTHRRNAHANGRGSGPFAEGCGVTAHISRGVSSSPLREGALVAVGRKPSSEFRVQSSRPAAVRGSRPAAERLSPFGGERRRRSHLSRCEGSCPFQDRAEVVAGRSISSAAHWQAPCHTAVRGSRLRRSSCPPLGKRGVAVHTVEGVKCGRRNQQRRGALAPRRSGSLLSEESFVVGRTSWGVTARVPPGTAREWSPVGARAPLATGRHRVAPR